MAMQSLSRGSLLLLCLQRRSVDHFPPKAVPATATRRGIRYVDHHYYSFSHALVVLPLSACVGEQQEALHQLWKELRGVFGELPLVVGKLIANVLMQLDDGKSPEQVSQSIDKAHQRAHCSLM